MADYFFDSSALAKRYISEAGSGWVINTTDLASANAIFVANITGVEVVSALSRRARGNKLAASDALAAISALTGDLFSDYFLTDISLAIVRVAMRLAEKHALRGYDAVQLAAALNINQANLAFGLPPIVFVSADDVLNRAAQAEGLGVENPNNYP